MSYEIRNAGIAGVIAFVIYLVISLSTGSAFGAALGVALIYLVGTAVAVWIGIQLAKRARR